VSPETYTQVYDAIVAGIRRWAPRGSANMKFVGLALEADEMSYVDYFRESRHKRLPRPPHTQTPLPAAPAVNASNHVPGTPLDMILPAFTLSLGFAAYIARLTRMSMIEQLQSDYIRPARAKTVGVVAGRKGQRGDHKQGLGKNAHLRCSFVFVGSIFAIIAGLHRRGNRRQSVLRGL
jgi:hypothetical protein